MARVSIEDCLGSIENRFALVMVASDRTRSLMSGDSPLVRVRNKEVVTALREIAEGKISANITVSEVMGQIADKLLQDNAALAAAKEPK